MKVSFDMDHFYSENGLAIFTIEESWGLLTSSLRHIVTSCQTFGIYATGQRHKCSIWSGLVELVYM